MYVSTSLVTAAMLAIMNALNSALINISYTNSVRPHTHAYLRRICVLVVAVRATRTARRQPPPRAAAPDVQRVPRGLDAAAAAATFAVVW